MSDMSRADYEAKGFDFDASLREGRAVRRAGHHQDGRPLEGERADLRKLDLIVPVERRSGWLEKDEQRECWRILKACGWRAWWLSQARKTGQTTGLPDIFARHLGLDLVVWMEVKRWPDPAPWTPAQQDFAASCTSHEHYILGTAGNLLTFLREHGVDV